MRLFAVLLLMALATPLTGQEKDIKLQTIKYDALKDFVVKNRGKVIYVDFWFNTCPPCIKGFAHVVALYEKWKDKGFVAVTVNVNTADEEPREAYTKAALEILKTKNVALQNFALDEKNDFVKDKLRLSIYPAAYIFDRQGRWTVFGGDLDKNPPVASKQIDPLIEKLVAEK